MPAIAPRLSILMDVSFYYAFIELGFIGGDERFGGGRMIFSCFGEA
jgi:hypothetical protein